MPPLLPLPEPFCAAGKRGGGVEAWNFRPIRSTWSAGQPSSLIDVAVTGGSSLGNLGCKLLHGRNARRGFLVSFGHVDVNEAVFFRALGEDPPHF